MVTGGAGDTRVPFPLFISQGACGRCRVPGRARDQGGSMPGCPAIASSRSAAAIARAMCRSSRPSLSGATAAQAASASGCPASAPASAAASASRSATCPASIASSGTLPAGVPSGGIGILHPPCCSGPVGEPPGPACDHLAPGLAPALGDLPLHQPPRPLPLRLRLPRPPAPLLPPFLLL